ncbi:MAG: hypothetical protein WEC39_01280 [Patescibacteria group bacterium]
MNFALIAVDTYQDPTKKLFTYSIPENLHNSAQEGAKVKIPFGRRQVEGYIWQLTNKKPPFPVKPLQEVKGQTFFPHQVRLAHWMVSYYLGSPLDCLKCQISEKGEREATTPVKEVTTLLLVPFASQVKIRAAIEKQKGNKVLVGSRAAVFAQLPNLKKIVIEEPENWNYKDERAPYYHAAAVVKKRAGLENLKVEVKPFLPSVEAYAENPKPLPRLNRIGIIDLTLEKAAGNFSFVSQELKNTLKRQSSTLIYSSSKVLQHSVKEELQNQGFSPNIFTIAGPEIFAFTGLETNSIIWIDADTLLNLPDFRAHEKLVYTAAKLKNLAKKNLFIQTQFPHHPLFTDLSQGKLANLYQRELEDRKKLNYPPFATLLKLSFASRSAVKTTQESEKLAEGLANLTKNFKGLEISPFYEPYQPKPGIYQLNLAIKIRNGEEILNKIVPLIPTGWRADRDPESLL